MKTIRNPPMLLNTPGVCNCDTISYCDTVFLFLACRCERKKHLSLSSSLQTARMVVFFFYYTRCNTPKHVRSSPGPSPLTVPGQHANTGLFEMSQRWRAVVNIVFNLTGPRFEHQTSRSKDELVAA